MCISLFLPWYSCREVPFRTKALGDTLSPSEEEEQRRGWRLVRSEWQEKEEFFKKFGLAKRRRDAYRKFYAIRRLPGGVIVYEADGRLRADYARAAGKSTRASVWGWETSFGLTALFFGSIIVAISSFAPGQFAGPTIRVVGGVVLLACAVFAVASGLYWWFYCPRADIPHELKQGPAIGAMLSLLSGAVIILMCLYASVRLSSRRANARRN